MQNVQWRRSSGSRNVNFDSFLDFLLRFSQVQAESAIFIVSNHLIFKDVSEAPRGTIFHHYKAEVVNPHKILTTFFYAQQRGTQRRLVLVKTTAFASHKIAQHSFLIIGYGNELRGDDAVGAQVARAVADWHLPEVKARMVHRIVPELAIEVAKADYVIFVDACDEESCARTVQLDPIVLGGHDIQSASAFSHTHGARGLLRLTEQLYGYSPQAWLLQVPSEDFALGKQLSDTAQEGCNQVLIIIERFLTNYQVP